MWEIQGQRKVLINEIKYDIPFKNIPIMYKTYLSGFFNLEK